MPSAWAINEDNGSPEYAAQELRRIAGMTLWPGVSHRFGARQGVRPGGGAVVTVSGTTWTQHDLTAVVYPGVTSISGPYVVEKAAESDSLNPADGSNPRIDALDLQVRDDDEDASGERDVRVVYAPGTPASSPSAPGVTPNSLRLATILVPAGGSPSPSVQTLAPFTVASGGILPLRPGEALPTAGVHEGAYADRDGLLWRRGASSWAPPRGWTPIASGSVDGAAEFTVDATADGLFPAGTFERVRLTLVGRTSGVANLTIRINGISSSDSHQSSFIAWNADNDGAPITDETDSGVEGTTARIGRWSTSLRGNSVEVMFFDTAQSSRCAYQADSVRQATNAGNFGTFVKAWGSLQADELLSSVVVRTAGLSTNFLGTSWTVEGLRL